MRISAWLIIELDRHNEPIIKSVRKRRPRNEMAVHVTLDLDMDALQPHVEALIQHRELIALEITTEDADDDQQ